MRRMIYQPNDDAAPSEVWLEWSVLPDGSDPVLEDDHLTPRYDLEHRPVRYVRANIYTTAPDKEA